MGSRPGRPRVKGTRGFNHGPGPRRNVASCERPDQEKGGQHWLHLTGPDSEGNYSATASFIPTSASRYQRVASYGGDPNNGASHTECGDEHEASLVMETAGLTTTLSSSSVNVGDKVHDRATLTRTSSFKPCGEVTYTVYTDEKCNDRSEHRRWKADRRAATLLALPRQPRLGRVPESLSLCQSWFSFCSVGCAVIVSAKHSPVGQICPQKVAKTGYSAV